MKRAALLVSVLFIAVGLLVAAGALDALARDGAVDRKRVYATLAFHYPLTLIAILAVARWRRAWRNYLLLGVSVLAALVAGEIGVRLLYPHEAMPRFRAIPSTRHHHLYPPRRTMYAGVYEGAPVVVATNEDGLRTRHSRETFASHAGRIAILGDSFVFGDKVRQEAIFPELLEALLRERLPGKDVAVLNAGVASYSPFLERILFERRLAAYRPGLVLLFLDATDVGDDHKYLGEARGPAADPRFDLPEPGDITYAGALPEVLRVHLPDLVRPVAWVYPFKELSDRLEPWYNYYDFHLEIGDRIEKNRFFIYRHPLETTRPYFDRTMDEIRAIASAARGMGARFALVIVPRFHHWNIRECPDNWERGEYRLDEPHQFEYFRYFEEAAPDAGFPVVSLLPAFRNAREFPLVLRFDPHWNERGHAFVAATMADYLIREGLVE